MSRTPARGTTLAALALALPLLAVPGTAGAAPARVEALPAPAPLSGPVPDDGSPLGFSATIPSDPQRSQGEPAVTTDPAGRIYSCGPTGFSSVNDFATVSTDGGDQFHLVGSAPRGQVSTGEGGGDCALATSPVKNAVGDYTLAYAGLGPLTNFSTATSADGGRTLAGSPVSESLPGVDRQWITFLDATTAILTYNGMAPSGKTVQTSTDGGLTYGPSRVVTPDSGRIGQIRSFLPAGATDRRTQSVVYLPYSNGTRVKMAVSRDGGATYGVCTVLDAGVSPDAGFVSADHDEAGNLYFAYSEKGRTRDTFLATVPFDQLAGCTGGADLERPAHRVSSGPAETTLFPWIAARGLPGRAAVAFYGTDQDGNPDSGTFDAAWQVFVSQTLDGLADEPTFTQVQATTHPFHYDSICTAGLNCTINNADRSLVDYFTMELDPVTGALVLVYSQPAKRPDEATGHVATPAVLTQVSGPSNLGGSVDRGFRRQVLRTSSPDPAGDAVSGYSVLNPGAPVVRPADVQVPALDLVGDEASPAVRIGSEPSGGYTVTLRLKDLSDAALQQALTADPSNPAGSLVYLHRFVDGYQSAGVSARWSPLTGWDFAYAGYQVQNALCASSGEECTTYTKEVDLTGAVDQEAGTIRIDVPRRLLTALQGVDAAHRPLEVAAPAGARLYDGTAVTLRNTSPDPDVQSFMEQVDGAAAFDFLLPTAAPAAPAAGSSTGGGLLGLLRRLF